VERLLGHAEAERAAQLAGLRHLATHRAEGGGGGGGGANGAVAPNAKATAIETTVERVRHPRLSVRSIR
jgi:hypothetical protein